MRRQVGVGAVKNKAAAQAKYRDKSNALADAELSQMSQQVETFRTHLETFAAKHGTKIRQNGEFRAQFQMMCAAIGVDPLASSKGFWSELLGVGDWYFELGVKIIEVCMANQGQTGGLMDINELRRILNKKRTTHETTEITTDDICRSVDKLQILGSGFRIIRVGTSRVGERRLMVQSVPNELNLDHTEILRLASMPEKADSAFVTPRQCAAQLSWNEERIRIALTQLVKEGIAWVDRDDGDNTQYWFPGVFQALLDSQS